MATISNTSANTDPATASTPSFENDLDELENIVTAMENGQMPLQEALDAYNRGVTLLRRCQETLSAAEQQVRLLDSNGLRDFDPESDGGHNG